jgi:tetratricopeptide (TPR) repeat protein
MYKINANLSIICILILISSVLTTDSLVLQLPNILAQNTSSAVDISKLNSNITKYAQVIRYYDKALAIDPNDTAALTNKGIVLIKLGNYTQAIHYFDKVLSIKLNNVGGLYNKAVALDNLGKYTEAKVFRDKALHINPNYAGQFINKVYTIGKASQPKARALAKDSP